MASAPSLIALRCFDASAQHGSFTKAAASIHVTQGAVSHQVLALEDLLGVRLFDRKRGGLQLTPAGLAYWRQISAGLRQIERATQELMVSKGTGGLLNLSAPSSFASYWLIPRLPAFAAAHREVTLNLSTRIGPADFDAAAPPDASIDFCTGESPGLEAVKIFDLQMRPYAAAALCGRVGRRRALTKTALVSLLAGHPLIRHTTAPLAWPGWLSQAGLLDDLEPGSLSAGPQYDLFSMALNGAIVKLGIALLPRFVAQASVDAGQLVELSDIEWIADKSYYLRFPPANRRLAPLQAFQSWLVEVAGRCDR